MNSEGSSTNSVDRKSAVLEVRDLSVKFVMDTGTVLAVNGASFHIGRGETVCVVGETGAGKSVTAFSVVRLLGAGGVSRRARLEGEIILRPGDGREYRILSLPRQELHSIRGRLISMIYQEPMTSLNPVYTCGNQIAEVLIYHGQKTKREAMGVAAELVKSVGIPDAQRVLKSYPHELSGGMKQRVMIAMALALHPALLIADEPTTSIDVTIQAQILNLFKQIQRSSGTSILFITHDVSVVAQLADRVVVMYAGHTVEIGSVYDVFGRPLHPYTQGLLKSIPKQLEPGQKPERLRPIPGTVPNPAALPSGCPFHPRCEWAQERCRRSMPGVEAAENEHTVMCWRWAEVQEAS
jgi:oligopeptide/dipeptide ABC transporter ATP-binding protein